MNYNQKFIRECEELYKKIKENNSIQECLNTAAAAATATTDTDTDTDIYEPLWFVYYMFFAIHNPKMEDYIQKKSAAATAVEKKRNPVDIIKNLLKRRNYTSTIVFELYAHAYTNEGNVTHIYPKYKNNILIKSFKENHLKTTAVIMRRECGATGADDQHIGVEQLRFSHFHRSSIGRNLMEQLAGLNQVGEPLHDQFSRCAVGVKFGVLELDHRIENRQMHMGHRPAAKTPFGDLLVVQQFHVLMARVAHYACIQPVD
jgi:hypothetical protein